MWAKRESWRIEVEEDGTERRSTGKEKEEQKNTLKHPIRPHKGFQWHERVFSKLTPLNKLKAHSPARRGAAQTGPTCEAQHPAETTSKGIEASEFAEGDP